MGHPQANNNTAAIAVIVIGLIFVVFIAGGLVVLGGLFFWASSSEMQVQPVAVTSIDSSSDVQPLAAPTVSADAQRIELDASGQIQLNDESVSMDELRERLNQFVTDELNAGRTSGPAPSLYVHNGCPHELVEEVESLCVETLGRAPSIFETETIEEFVAP